MMKFSNYIAESMKKKYVAVQYDDDTQIMLRNWCKKNGFDLSTKFDGTEQKESEFDFHTTIFFSTSEHDMKNGLFDLESSLVIPIGFELLGVDHNIPVLRIEGKELRDLRKKYENMGMKDNWPDWKPHISLSYNKKKIPDIRKIKVPPFTLKFDKLKIDDAVEL